MIHSIFIMTKSTDEYMAICKRMPLAKNITRYLFILMLCVTVGAMLFVNISLYANHKKEGFQTVPLIINPTTNLPQSGYYKVSDDKMALIPYGFGINPENPEKIVPVTKV